MNKIKIKPRWEEWENQCIHRAFEKKIPHKIIAVALEKTVSAISKRIHKLGLREPTKRPGRVRGQKSPICSKDKIALDVKAMTHIMQTCAPLDIFQKSQMVLQDRFWSLSKPVYAKKLERGESSTCLKKTSTGFSVLTPLDYLLIRPEKPNLTRIERIIGEPFYVPYEHVQHWATSNGFKLLKENLKEKGLVFWKEGRYFTRFQVLMHVNQIRSEKKLKPLFYSEDMDSYGKDSQNLEKTEQTPPQPLWN